MESTVLGLLFLAFLYFGYRDDFKRNPKKFIGTVLGVLGSFFILYIIDSWQAVFILLYNGMIYLFFFRNDGKEKTEK